MKQIKTHVHIHCAWYGTHVCNGTRCSAAGRGFSQTLRFQHVIYHICGKIRHTDQHSERGGGCVLFEGGSQFGNILQL